MKICTDGPAHDNRNNAKIVIYCSIEKKHAYGCESISFDQTVGFFKKKSEAILRKDSVQKESK